VAAPYDPHRHLRRRAATLPLGSVAFEPQTKDKGERRERYGTLALQSHTKKIIFGSSVRR
jgi:hypothetical protein